MTILEPVNDTGDTTGEIGEMNQGEISNENENSTAVSLEVDTEVEDKPTRKRCCGHCDFDNIPSAQGYVYVVAARGPYLVSFLFLSTSLMYLASLEAGCVDEEKQQMILNCPNKVYGFRPTSLITNVAVISGILSAFFMPFIGAIVDYSTHRKAVGIISALIMTLIQTAQAVALPSTWFAMTILAGTQGFFSEVQYCAYMAYLPEMARIVGETKMAGFTTTFFQWQMTSEMLYIILVTIIGYAFKLHDVQLAHISQATNALWIGICFILGWRLMPSVPAKHVLPDDHNLFTEGFVQVWRTSKNVNRSYKRSLRWFLLASLFGDTGVTAATAVIITFYTATLGLNGRQIGIHFIITLFFTLPGAQISSYVTRKTNPPTSWKLCMIAFIIVTAIATAVLDSPERAQYVYVWDFLWGVVLGWFYPTEQCFFSLCLPKGQETEISGFFVYCTQIISWFPPLVFTLLNERGFHARWGLLSLNLFVLIGLIMLFMMSPWEEALAEVHKFEGKDEVTADAGDLEASKKETHEVSVSEKNDEHEHSS